MKNVVTASIASVFLLLSTGAVAADAKPTEESAPLSCGDQRVLNTLANNVASVNKLSNNLQYHFDRIWTISDESSGKRANLKCLAHLNLVDPATKTTLDSLGLEYSLVEEKNGSFTLSFTPKR